MVIAVSWRLLGVDCFLATAVFDFNFLDLWMLGREDDFISSEINTR